jgi:hypothetical protein
MATSMTKAGGIMAIVRERCSSCGLEIDVTVGQAVDGGQLVWYKAYACPYCGRRQEEDGRGPTKLELLSSSRKASGL